MSVSIAKAQGALKKEEGKLKKILKAVKKFMSKEFLWMLFVALLALPLTLIMVYLVETYFYTDADIQNTIETILEGQPLWVGCLAVSVAGIYFSRAVAGAIKQLTESKKEG